MADTTAEGVALQSMRGFDPRAPVIPTHAWGNLDVLLPDLGPAARYAADAAGFKRPGSNDGAAEARFIGYATASLNKRFRAGYSNGAEAADGFPGADTAARSYVAAAGSAMPPGMASRASVINAGFSTDDAQTDGQVITSIFMRPFEHGWHAQIGEFMPLFVNRDLGAERLSPGIFAAATPAIINTVLEVAEAVRPGGGGVALSGRNRDAALALYDTYEPMAATSGHEFAQRWSPLGNFTTSGGGGADFTSDMRSVSDSSAEQQLIGTSRFARTNVFNLFSPTLRPGDQVYFAATRADVSAHAGLLGPNGNTLARRARPEAHALQLLGCTDRDTGMLPHDTSCDSEQKFAGPLACVHARPSARDANYALSEMRAARDYLHFDYDDGGAPFKVRDLAAEEGMQEAVASLPQRVHETYTYNEGAVFPWGVVREVKADTLTTSVMIARGHRDHRVMRELGRVELYGL